MPALLAAVAWAGCGGGEDGVSVRAAGRPPATIAKRLPDPFAPTAAQLPGTFVGAADGADYVAVVVADGEAAVYVCDGASSDWFGGPVRDGRIALRSPRGTVVEAAVGDGDVRGTVRRARGEEQAFTARPPTTPGTGLFAGPDGAVAGAVRRWIVLEDGIRGVSDTSAGKGAGVVVAQTAPPPSDSDTVSGSSSGTGKAAGTTTFSSTPTPAEDPPAGGGSSGGDSSGGGQISDGTSNTIMVEERPPSGGGEEVRDGTSNTIVVSETPPAPPSSSTDGSVRTISVGERPAGTSSTATITDGSSNTIVVGEQTARDAGITDGSSNTIVVGESGPSGGGSPPAGTPGPPANGVADKTKGVTIAPVTAQAPASTSAKTPALKIVVADATAAKKEPAPVAGGDKIGCAAGTTLRAGLLVGRLAALKRDDKAAAQLAAEQAAVLTAQLTRNGCKA